MLLKLIQALIIFINILNRDRSLRRRFMKKLFLFLSVYLIEFIKFTAGFRSIEEVRLFVIAVYIRIAALR